jgi:hypothetical protein
VESRLAGLSLDEEAVAPAVHAAMREQATEFLMDRGALYVEPGRPESIRDLVDREFTGLAPFVPQGQRDTLRRMAERMCRVLGEGGTPLVVHHGDFKCANFRYEPSPRPRLTGIVDWDLASIPGLPLLDLLTLHFDIPGSTVTDLPRSLFALACAADVPPVVRRYAERWDLGPEVVRQLALFTNVKHLNRHFHYSVRTRPAWHDLLRATLFAAE